MSDPIISTVDENKSSRSKTRRTGWSDLRRERREEFQCFTENVGSYFEARYQCTPNISRILFNDSSLRINTESVKLDLQYKPKSGRGQELGLYNQSIIFIFVAFDRKAMDETKALFSFILDISEKFDLKDFYIDWPNGLPKSFFKAHTFKKRTDGENGWYISREELKDAFSQ